MKVKMNSTSSVAKQTGDAKHLLTSSGGFCHVQGTLCAVAAQLMPSILTTSMVIFFHVCSLFLAILHMQRLSHMCFWKELKLGNAAVSETTEGYMLPHVGIPLCTNSSTYLHISLLKKIHLKLLDVK